MLAKRLLQRMQRVGSADAFDSRDARAVGLDGEHCAGLNRALVDIDGASAAVAGVAADVGAGQSESLAQNMHEQFARLDRQRSLDSVYD